MTADDHQSEGDRVVGIDWASRGWLCVGLTRTPDGGLAWEASMEPSMHAACRSYADATAILVDIPIGLPAAADRACDRDAKALLGKRASSVFWTPCRRAAKQPSPPSRAPSSST